MSFLTTSDGTRLRVCDRGSGPETIVLVHGWKFSHRAWDATIAQMADRFRIVAYDLRGMGESDKPRCAYDFDEHAADLASILDQLELTDITLVGWSMGCSVSLQHMHRYGDRVARVVLLNGPIKLTQAPGFPWALTEEELAGYLDALAERWPAQERGFLNDAFKQPDPEIVDWMYSIALQTPLDVVLASVRNQARLDHRQLLSRIEIPVLAIYSRHDPYYPVGLADFIAEQAPRGERVILEDSAHCAPIEEGPRFRGALADFIERTTG